jgi:hypothetical protein
MLRRTTIILALLLTVGAICGAQDASPFSVDLASGIYYDAFPLTGSLLDIFLVLFNFRGGATIDYEYRFSPFFSAGGETGLMYMTLSDSNTHPIQTHWIDFPLRAKASLAIKAFTAEIFLGSMTNLSINDAGIGFAPYADAGVRVSIGPVFAEGSYEYRLGPPWTSGYPRLGLGAFFRLVE